MSQNFWVWWVHRPTEQELKMGFINELYLDAYGLWDKPKDDQELKNYIDLCKSYGVKPYLVVNGYASGDYLGMTIDDITKEIEARVKKYRLTFGANIMLDYLRSGGYTNLKITRKHIIDVLELVKKYDVEAKFAVFNWWKSRFHTQYYTDIRPRIKICPMIYGTDWTTRFWIWFHKTLFPRSEPCIRAWDTTKEEFLKQASMLQNFSVWKYPDWKELFK